MAAEADQFPLHALLFDGLCAGSVRLLRAYFEKTHKIDVGETLSHSENENLADTTKGRFL